LGQDANKKIMYFVAPIWKFIFYFAMNIWKDQVDKKTKNFA